MRKIFRNALWQKVIFTDEGIFFESRKKFYPYGSIDKIKVGLLGLSVENKAEGIPCTFAIDSSDKKAVKELVDYAIQKNAISPPAKPELREDIDDVIALDKNVDAIVEFFGGMTSKEERVVATGLPELLQSMKADEQILHAFDGSYIEINNESNTVRSYIALITNRRFYYAGCEGNAYLNHMKAGSVELQDIHAISIGEGTTTSSPYVKFEAHNDDYIAHSYCNIGRVKNMLEEAISIAKNTQQSPSKATSAADSADALIKFKELLDMGIITKEEFDTKKKQLLGL